MLNFFNFVKKGLSHQRRQVHLSQKKANSTLRHHNNEIETILQKKQQQTKKN